MERLLAKSSKKLADGTVVDRTLVQHTQDVVRAAEALFGTEEPTRLAIRWLEFFQIDEQWTAFRSNLLASCVPFPSGKLGSDFKPIQCGLDHSPGRQPFRAFDGVDAKCRRSPATTG